MIVIAKNENGPFRVGIEQFKRDGLALFMPNHVALRIEFSGNDQQFFIVGPDGKDVYGHGFKLRDDADLIMMELQNGWLLELTNTAAPLGAAVAGAKSYKVAKRGRHYVVIDASGATVDENKFTNEVEAYTHMVALNA